MNIYDDPHELFRAAWAYDDVFTREKKFTALEKSPKEISKKNKNKKVVIQKNGSEKKYFGTV